MEQIKQIWQESGYPAPARLYALAKSKGIQGVTHKEIKEFVDSQAVAQLHKKAPAVNPTPITVSGHHIQYQMDLLDLSAYSKSNEGKRWCLIVEDIFDRKAVAVPAKSKSPNDIQPALAEALKEMGGKPVQIVSDSGTEWMGTVKTYMEQANIVHRTVEVGDHRSLGIIDSFARFMKNAIHKHFTHNQSTDWISYLPQLIGNYNNTPHSSLKAKGQPALTPNESERLETDTRNIHIAAINKADHRKKPSGLIVGDSVRVLKRKQVFDRGYEIRYSVQIYKVKSVDGLWYILDNDKRYREGSLQKVAAPKSEAPKEESKEDAELKEDAEINVKDVAKEARFDHKTQQILTHKEGVSQFNKREGLRERKPESQLQHARYGKLRWN